MELVTLHDLMATLSELSFACDSLIEDFTTKCRVKATRERHCKYCNRRRKEDPSFKMKNVLRLRLLSALKGKTKSAHTLELLGCTRDDFMNHLQLHFKEGMNWNNHGLVWEIDHVLPCASFDLSDAAQQRICFHWTNLMPEYKAVNRSKGAKITQPQLNLLINK
jgi:hypothetical protein